MALTAWRCRAGNISLETALVTTVLLVLTLGAVDFGRYGLAHISLASAARAGAQYGVQSQSASGELASIEQAAREDAGDPGLDVVARQYCDCPGGGEVSCSTTCADGAYAQMYVEVTARDQVGLIFDYPGIGSPIEIRARSRMRVR